MKVFSLRKIKHFYYTIIHSLTFLPFVILVIYAIVAFVLVWLQGTRFSLQSLQAFPWMEIASASHAANIITTLLAGMISLTVFSFSVVMIVLSQAAQNIIPKVLYKLREDRFMQVVLGCYIGTITYYIVLLVNFGKEQQQLQVPHIAFFLGVILAVVNIFLFAYFMHRTSLSIHVKKIVERIFNDTKEKLLEEAEAYEENHAVEAANIEAEWKTYGSSSNGYIQSLDRELVSYLSKRDLIMKLHPVLGEYVIEKMPLFSLNKEVDEETAEKIESRLTFFSEERVSGNSKFGFRQITEIAIKALSPGINDPGTAIFCVDYLTELFAMLIKQRKEIYKRDKEGKTRAIGRDESFEDILFFCFVPLRNYGKKDVEVLETIVKSLGKISLHDVDNRYREKLNEHLVAVLDTARENISIEADLEHFKNEVVVATQKTGYFDFPQWLRNR